MLYVDNDMLGVIFKKLNLLITEIATIKEEIKELRYEIEKRS